MDDQQPTTLRAPFRAAAPEQAKRRLDQLLRADKSGRGGGVGYSRFVRAMRLLLPLVAVGIVGLVVSWPRVEERMTPPPEMTPSTQTVGQNELINPRFESEDRENQPFTVTAARAVQSSDNPDVVFLEKPVGDINLSDGSWVAAEAVKGAFDQRAETLTLEGHVKLFHDEGYEIVTEKLRVEMGARTAWSDTEINGHGPAGKLKATGVKADMAKGEIIFTGPAKLTLNQSIKGL
ncbi:MAG: LPS export ABC transporter periplasmic protein LptC [Alphaproteobacteria bacterium]|nr:LPS export ABC transporter periplasmic protein LptC [Alphaproteobacteria bacterium]MBU0859010.1 LPS export ABC transporter periplasmic protein LptC [Alphaproteobacteria bacterium]